MANKVRGRNLVTGLPKTVTVSSSETEEALREPTSQIVEAVIGVLERTPPELSADILDRGIVLTGGGALLRGLEELIEERTGIHTMTAEDPMQVVAIEMCIRDRSGSGKSSLAFDTIYAEGQRRYMESLSSYARQFLGQMEKPNVESIEGLSPAISIDQKSTNRNPRSTVGTVTEIYDYFRLLYARIGIPHCPNCGKEIKKMCIRDSLMTVGEILSYLIFLLIKNGMIYFAVYSFPAVQMLCVFVILVIVCVTVPLVVLRSVSKESLVERLRKGQD